MDFGFDVSYLFQCDKEGIAIVDGNQFKNMNKKILYSFNTVLDSIGEASAKVRVYFKKAQSLKAVITNGIRFIGSDHIIYIKCEESAVIGFLKVGKKKLFIVDEIAKIREINPMCVLDFYVHESQQRNGYGKVYIV
jgi:alpha-tubulin N-acetyltransferase 1